MTLPATLRVTFLGFAAVGLAIAALSLAAPSAQAFTFESLGSANADGSSRYADPDDQVKNFGRGGLQFGAGGPVMQVGPQQQRFGGFLGSGYVAPPEPYARPLGSGD